MAETPDNTETSDPYSNEQVSDMWLDVTDLCGDPTLAKKIIESVAVQIWNLPWNVWSSLHEHASK